MGQSCLSFFNWGFVHHKPGGGKFIRVYVIIITLSLSACRRLCARSWAHGARGARLQLGPMGRPGLRAGSLKPDYAA